MAINTADLEYDKNERTNSQMNEQTTPEDHTDSMKRAIMTACWPTTKIILGTEL